MKNVKLILVLCAAIVLASCSKEDTGSSSSIETKTLSPKEQELVKERFLDLSKIAVYNHTMDKIIFLDVNADKTTDFSFADPNDGWTFGTSDNIQFVNGPNGGAYIFVSPNGGGNGSAGVITAGPSTLPIDYAFCFSVDSENAFNSPDADDVPADGVSGVLGFSGDLEALTSEDMDPNDDPFEYFRGWAYFWVYADEANGDYDILDWLDYDGDDDEVQDRGFAFVYDYQEGHVYWSLDGTLGVSGGSMDFEGEFFAWLDFLDLLFEGDDFEGSEEVVEGFGAMGC